MTTNVAAPIVLDSRPGLGVRQRIARRLVHGQLTKLRTDRVTLVEAWSGERTAFGPSSDTGHTAVVTVHDPSFYTAMVARGSLGVAESWTAGDWTCDALTELVRIMIRNRDVLDGMEGGIAKLSAPFLKLLHRRNDNTRSGSRRNIAAHYDLGNDFFEQFLDETMSYSCGVFERDDATMAEASRAKLDRLCRKLDLGPDDHLLEIGTGWGSMALHAAGRFGCRVTTTTISREQHAIAAKRIRDAGLEDRVTLLLQDYRDLDGQYDKLVSCEMVEAVGHRFLPAFLKKCGELLKPDGIMAMQAILIADQHYERAVREVDFIKRYIFPGSFIPSTTAIVDAATRASDLRLFHLEEFGPHYVRTLREWRRTMHANVDRIRTLGYGEEFLRMWEDYLGYCEGGFAERFIGVGQFVFTRPEARAEPILPDLGARSAV